MKGELCIIFFFTAMTWSRAGKDYCSITCAGKRHSMCAYQDDGPGPGCHNFKKQPLSEQDKATILGKHNELRNKVAQGKQHPQPSASNMMQLEWDDELAAIAQRWADQCNFAHDACRNTAENDWVGQNVASSGKSGVFLSQLEGHISRWFSEVNHTDTSIIRCFQEIRDKSGLKVGHYTQMVYAETRYIGCGRSFYITETKGRMHKELLVCNYKPGGNLQKQPVYLEGRPCSLCPEGTRCSADYPALCSMSSPAELVFFYALVCETTHVYSVDYCQLNCDDDKHTVCLYPKAQPSENCKGYKEKLISESDKHLIVDLHNNFRNKVAGGEELIGTPGPQPPAADMMEVDWDDEIAFIAQQWAYQCKFAHDACRRVKDSSVGQNLAIEINTDKFHHDFSSAIKGWYDEVKDVPPSIVDEFKATEGHAIGHYTQMINAKSAYVGCGHVFYEAEGAEQYASQLGCNYKPSGNVLGTPIYKKGKPCSQCPSGTKCSKTWKNLCSTGKRRYGKGAADKYYPRPNLVVVLLLLVLGP